MCPGQTVGLGNSVSSQKIEFLVHMLKTAGSHAKLQGLDVDFFSQQSTWDDKFTWDDPYWKGTNVPKPEEEFAQKKNLSQKRTEETKTYDMGINSS